VSRILIVEDDFELREVLAETLLERGHFVDGACDGKDALDRLTAGPAPDVILLDLMMPNMSGWQFRARQLAMQGIAHIPTIVMSTGANLQRAAIAADYFVPKPVNLQALLLAITKCANDAETRTTQELPIVPAIEVEDHESSWRLVSPKAGEMTRWQDDHGRWVSLSLGEDEGLLVVQDDRGRRFRFDEYEDALKFCRSLRT
jgi:two-component system response regulator MprA